MHQKIDVASSNPREEVPKELIQPRGLSEELAAIYSGVSSSALRKARMDGKRIGYLPPPPYVRLGRKIIYLIDDLDLWLESNRVGGCGDSQNKKPDEADLFSGNQAETIAEAL